MAFEIGSFDKLNLDRWYLVSQMGSRHELIAKSNTLTKHAVADMG